MSLTKATYSMILGASFNLLDFGADSTGATDSTTAISAALTAMADAGGGELYIPAGTYQYTSFVVAVSNVQVRGDGWGVTVLKPQGWCDGIRFANGYPSPTSVLSNVAISNLTIDCSDQTAGANDTYGNGVNFNDCDWFSCDKVQVLYNKQQGIVSTYFPVSGSRHIAGYITNNYLDVSQSNNIAIGAEANNHCVMISGNVIQNLQNPSHVGIYVGNLSDNDDAGDVNIVNNNITGSVGTNRGVGIKIEDVAQKIVVADNYIYGLGVGIRAVLTNTATTYNYSITGNQLQDWTDFGIILQPLAVGQNSQALIAANSLFTSNASATASAIRVENGAFVSSNRIYAFGALYGIHMTGDGSVATGNYIDAVTGYSIEAVASTNTVLLSNYTTTDVELGADTVNFGGGGYATQRWTNNYFGTQQNKSGVAAPVSGAWTAGDKIWNASPTSGGYIGWVCTASGTPGTWKTFGLIS